VIPGGKVSEVAELVTWLRELVWMKRTMSKQVARTSLCCGYMLSASVIFDA